MRKKASLAFLAQTAFVWGLVLFGWGLDDVRGFFAHPARAGVVVLTLLGPVDLLLSSTAPNALRKGEKPVAGQGVVLLSFVGIMLFLAWFLPYADRRSLLVYADSGGLRYAGLALNVLGAAMRVAAAVTLGKQLSGYVTLQKDHELVTRGIYGVMRHPMYAGLLLAFPGWALVLRSQLTIPLLVVILVFVILRIGQEEKLLAEHFGAEFAAYRQRTWRLLPYIY